MPITVAMIALVTMNEARQHCMSDKKGLIVKGIAGFYYVKSGDEVYRCKARGVFKQRSIKPAVGDDVEFEIIPDNDDSLITKLLPRRNSFIRPFIANVDCFAVVVAAASPAPILSVIDRFMVMAEKNGTEAILCINKCDLANENTESARKARENIDMLRRIYEPIYPVLLLEPASTANLDEFRRMTSGSRVALAGPSGVGKSTILNRLLPHAQAETGEISTKSDRGRHTTRHAELFTIDEEHGTMIFDTPGFTSFDIMEADEDELQHFYPEMREFIGGCRYHNCKHLSEPECSVRQAVEDGRIAKERYESYQSQMAEIHKAKQY